MLSVAKGLVYLLPNHNDLSIYISIYLSIYLKELRYVVTISHQESSVRERLYESHMKLLLEILIIVEKF